MAKYLIKIKPIEPYFFGNENTFRINEDNNYIIISNTMPSSSSVIGMLRFQLLKSNKLLNANGKYDDEQQKKCDELIGKCSYAVGTDNDFGKIKSISPLFLIDNDNNILIHTPLNNIGDDIYRSMELTQKVSTSFGEIDLPTEFSAKKIVSDDSFVRLSDARIFNGVYDGNPIFSKISKVGIGIENKDYFKKGYCMLNESLSFAIIAEIDDDAIIKNDFCYMGREKSVFKLTVESAEQLDIEKEISAIIPDNCYYAFGDVFISDAIRYNAFAMVKTDKTRVLSTTKKNGKIVLNRGLRLYNVIKAGSIFYDSLPEQINNSETKFGFNKTIKGE